MFKVSEACAVYLHTRDGHRQATRLRQEGGNIFLPAGCVEFQQIPGTGLPK